MTHITVGIADYAVGAEDLMLVTTGLGSCVAIALHSRGSGVGALAHVLLPNAALTGDGNPAKSASTAVPVMLRRMRELGAGADIEARIVGGASMFSALLTPGAVSLGTRNVNAARAACAAASVPVVAEDVGGSHGRSVFFDVSRGHVQVRSLATGDVEL